MWSMACPTVQCSGAMTTSRCIRRPGGVFRVGQRLFSRDPVGILQRVQDRLLLRLFQVFQQVDNVVAFQLAHRLGQNVGLQDT